MMIYSIVGRQYCVAGLILLVSLALSACAEVRDLSAVDIQNQVSRELGNDSLNRNWLGPELIVRHFRIRFYGYDVVYYRLFAIQGNQPTAEPKYRLLIDANYGGEARHYDTAKSLTGTETFPSINLRHDTVRCQLFSNMYSACLFRDRAELLLSAENLNTARESGLSLRLGSAEQDYELIDLPANYVEGFLKAVENR